MKKVLTALICLVTCLSCFACRKAGALFSDKTDSVPQEVVSSSPADLSLGGGDAQPSFPLNANGDPYSLASYVGYIELGSYPQTIAHHKALAEMSLTTDSTGYYYSTWDNEHYAKISKSKVYGKRFKFSEDSLIVENETYYFKVEPIKWWVFFSGEMVGAGKDTITLVSEQILDSHYFCAEYSPDLTSAAQDYYRNDNPDVLANEWAYSDLRTWLNDDFLKKAFSLTDERLLVSRVTPGASDEDPAATEKIWVPSNPEISAYRGLFDALNTALQDHHAAYLAQVSDYARCRNTFISIYPDYYGCGRYWTSSAGNTSYRASFAACDNHDKSGTAGESVGSSYMGVRPVICLYADDVTSLLKDADNN